MGDYETGDLVEYNLEVSQVISLCGYYSILLWIVSMTESETAERKQ